MAKEDVVESQEEFITLDDDEEEVLEEGIESPDTSDLTLEEEESNNKLLYILIGIFALLAFLMLGFLLYLYMDKQATKKEDNKTAQIITNIQNKEMPEVKTASYEKEILKAKKLYKLGKKEEALAIYDSLSRYNKALTSYNIGVAALQKGHFDKAIDAFLSAEKNDKLRFESQLNIAIAAFNKEDNQNFEKYLTLAAKSLTSKVNSPLYGYYRTLIDYYRGFYAEALVPLRHPTSNFYPQAKQQLLAKLYTAFDNHNKAIKTLEKQGNESDFFTLGLLYANQAQYTLAQKYLQKAAKQTSKPLDENLALALVNMKMGLYKKASALLNESYKNFKENSSKHFPIKVSLKPALFDPVAAQEAFAKNLFFNDRNRFSLIFYFAPYRLVNPSQSIQNINQGANNIYVHALDQAQKELTLSGQISDANIENTKGIKAALNENLYKAKALFEAGIQKYPSSAQLHYNLALTYAKMYQFQEAYKHFKRSAILDTGHYLAPLFAQLCASLLYQDIDKSVLTKIDDQMQNQPQSEEKENILSLIAILRGDIYKPNAPIGKTAFQDALTMILAQTRQDASAYAQSTQALLQKLPDNLISNILYLDAHNDKNSIKEYAKAIQRTLSKPSLDFSSLYSGHALSKELYIEMLNIAGIVIQAKRMLENRIRQQGANDIASLQALAYTDIYLQDFDQAYAIYNNLIDEHKQQDSNTLFLAAIASIGAAHHANAIALLELAKLSNTANLESRFALGILYHEAKNLEGASIQYAKIGDGGFQSRYFTFDLKAPLDKNHLK